MFNMKKTMRKDDTELLKKVLERLRSLDPPVKKIAVDPPDPAMNMYFLDLKGVCYITSRTDSGRSEIMFVTADNKRFYNNLSLRELDKKLEDHPHFIRTSKFYIINLTKVRGFRYSSARDLWFEGHEEPIINAVTSTYLEKFEKYFR